MHRYGNLLPWLLRMLPPDSPQLGRQLRGLRDPQGLWSSVGLRSLAASSTLYRRHNTEHDAPYWRGPVWMNINFLALAALDYYAQVRCCPPSQACRSSVGGQLSLALDAAG